MPSILSRIGTLLSANINAMIDNAEDPQQMVAQYISQLTDQLQEARAATAQAMAVSQNLQGQYQTYANQVSDWQDKAALAVQNNNDQLATQALTQKANAQKLADTYKAQYDAQDQQVQALRDALAQLEAKINEAQSKQQIIQAKLSQAQSQQAINQANQSLQSTTGDDTFSRMEQKADTALYTAQAQGQLLQHADLNQQFSDLETQGQVQSDLAALKAQYGKS